MTITINVLLLTDADVFAGTERHILELAASLPAAGVKATIGCPVPSPLAERARDERISVLPVGLPRRPKAGRADLATIARIRKAWNQSESDLVHAHNGRSALIAAMAGAGRRVPLVMTQHFLRPARTSRSGFNGFASRLIHQWLDNRICHHIAISDAVRTASLSASIAPPNRLTTVHNGIRSPSLEKVENVVAGDPWLAGAEPLIFCAARAEPEKDLPTLLQAMVLLRADYPRARCAIAGGGRDLESLRQSVASEGGEQANVRLLGFRKDVANLMSAADIFVLPSPAEPFGLVLLEAMALGKPVVACDAGGPREIIEPSVTGFLVQPRSASDMAQALAALIVDRQRAQQMGSAGRARYKSLFTAELMARRTAAVYEKVLQQGVAV